MCGLLKADDSPGPVASDYEPMNQAVWYVEHTALIAKDPEMTGVQAVMEADKLLKSRDPQVSIDFFNKALYDTKNRAVQRAIRVELTKLYTQTGQNDKALDQLDQLITIDEQ